MMKALAWAAVATILAATFSVVGIASVSEQPPEIPEAQESWVIPERLDPISLLNERIDRTNFVVDGKCSGTFIDAEHSLILTNAHCVRGKAAEEGETTVTQGIYRNHVKVGETTWEVDIVATDKDKDLALLQFRAGYVPHDLPAQLLPPEGTIKRGERVYIVGNPGGLEASLIPGFVSSVTRNVTEMRGVVNTEPRALIQVSGGIYGGNSGGALYNEQGELIAVPTMVRRGVWHLGFAVPAEVIHEFLKEQCFGANREPCLAKADREDIGEES